MNTFNYVCLSLLAIFYVCVFVVYFMLTRKERVSTVKVAILVKCGLYFFYNLTLMTYDAPSPIFHIISAIFGEKSTIGFSVFMFFIFRLFVLFMIYNEIYFCITYIDSFNKEEDKIMYYYYIPPLGFFFLGILIHDDLYDLMMYMLLMSILLCMVFSIIYVCFVDKVQFIEINRNKYIVILLMICYGLLVIGDWVASFAYFYNYNRGPMGSLLPKLHFLFSLLAFGVQMSLVLYSKDIINEKEIYMDIIEPLHEEIEH